MRSARSFGFPYIAERAPCRRPPYVCRLTILVIAIAANGSGLHEQDPAKPFYRADCPVDDDDQWQHFGEIEHRTLNAPPLQTGEKTTASQSWTTSRLRKVTSSGMCQRMLLKEKPRAKRIRIPVIFARGTAANPGIQSSGRSEVHYHEEN
jgi:hypothetical protein